MSQIDFEKQTSRLLFVRSMNTLAAAAAAVWETERWEDRAAWAGVEPGEDEGVDERPDSSQTGAVIVGMFWDG